MNMAISSGRLFHCPIVVLARVKRVLVIITCTTWLLKSMTERRDPGVHSALMFFLSLSHS